jgi:hypothetical protein
MPKTQGLRDIAKEHRELEDILESAEKLGRYGKRSKEVTDRTAKPSDHKKKE